MAWFIKAVALQIGHASVPSRQYPPTPVFQHCSTHPHQWSTMAVPTHASVPSRQYPPTPVFHHRSTHPRKCSITAVPTHTSVPAWQYHLHQCSSMAENHPHQCSSMAVPPTPVFQHGSTTHTCVPAWCHIHTSFTMATFTRVRTHSLPFLFIWFLCTQVCYKFKG